MNQKRFLYLDFAGIIGAAVLAILCGFVIIMFVSSEPLHAISSFLLGPLSSPFNISTILNKAVPLIFTGLALAVVFQTNVFSMGAEGQLYVGGFAGALAAVYIGGISPWIHLPIILICAIVGGALFGAVPGLLKARLNANEVVTTLMLNYIAIIGTSYLVNNVFKDPASGGYARMPFFDKSILLGKISPAFPAHYGILIAVVAVIVIYLLLFKTRIGYELRLVGKNDKFARYGGIKTKRVIVVSVMISGALAGLAGIVELLGVHGTYKDNFSAKLGFDGIIIALLARNHPIGVLFAAVFYAYLQVGGQVMQAESDVSRELSVIIQVLLVLFVSAQAVFNYLKQRQLMKQKKVTTNDKAVKTDVA
ncbi:MULTISPECIES: ABC transporter permease [unclassified Paenibacillus]|uniref:ABC transporter permease n=1 Tax=unclassified Paenibacillus TaxID=185978 RepID=UPI001C1239DE|nr:MULTISPECIES: ABC transporter permease [unclassified Paenibacillus]MBU5445372.1 ABC transporter permease [Paenibacillus sp. MSJ-34]CAH0122499.1 putative riboflavin import permease protein RfuC [Paenibacillus sp. CECT 9249]